MDDRTDPAPDLPSAMLEAAIEDFLGWFRDNTRMAYEFDMKIYRAWCAEQGIDLLMIRRRQIEAFLLHCEETRGNSLRTIKRRLSTLRRFYGLVVDDGLINRSPADRVRVRHRYRPDDHIEVDLGLTRYEMAALLHAAIAARPVDAGLVVLMGVMGLRVSEACNLKVADALHVEQDHRVLKFVGKGGKSAMPPIPPQAWRILEPLTRGEPAAPLLLRPNTGTAMDRISAARTVIRLTKAAGIERHVTPHDLRRGYVSGLFDAGASMRQAQTGARHADPRMTALYDRRRRSLDQHPNYLFASWLSGAS